MNKEKIKTSLAGISGEESYFDRVAHAWDERQPQGDIIDAILAVVHINKGDNVLDAGSGTGVLLPRLSRMVGDSGHVLAADSSRKMLEVSQAKNAGLVNVEFRYVDIEDVALDERFDKIVMFNMFPHLKRPLATLKRLVYNNLKPGGRLLLAHSMGCERLNAMHSQHFADSDYFKLPAVGELEDLIRGEGMTTCEAVDDTSSYRLVVML